MISRLAGMAGVAKVARLAIPAILLFCHSASSQVAQLSWDVQQDRPVAHDVYIWQGETADLLPRLVQGIRPVAVTNAPVEFRYREAALPTNTYRYVTASASTNTGVLSVRWLPDYDAGAAWYDYQIIVGSNAANPRCFGRIIMRPTIGWPASTNAPAPITLYATREDLQAVSNDLAAAMQASGTIKQEVDALDYSLGAHMNRTDNPHAVTATQIGATTPETVTSVVQAAIAALPTPSTDALRLMDDSGSRWIDGTGGVWQVTSGSNLAYRITADSYIDTPLIGYSEGDVFEFVSDQTSTNLFYIERVRRYTHQLFHITAWNADGGALAWQEWVIPNVKDGEYGVMDLAGTFEYPAIGQLNGSWGPEGGYLTLEAFWQPSISTTRVDGVVFEASKELHADSFTNLVWRSVFSNGWHWLVAYTNTP